jgi:glycogen(starch) synthase
MCALTYSESPRRVLMTADAVGGVWTYALELARGLAALGIEVTIATMGPPPNDAQRADAAALDGVVLRESTFRLEWMENPWDDLERAGDWLLAVAEEFSPDVVHLNGYAHAALPWMAPCLVVGHSCVLSWWEAVHGSSAPDDWHRYREIVRRGLHSAALVAAPTWTMLNALERHYGPLPASTVIPNGRNLGEHVSHAVKEPFVLSVGRLWDEAKNTSALAEAAAGLLWPVRIVGERCSPDGRARSFDNVELLGRREAPDLRALYRRAGIYALPARYEPFGLSVLEAALAGCALVLGDIPSLRENWEGAAVFVPPEDREQLGSALAALIDAPLERERLGRRARERARHFSSDRMVQAYLQAYAGLTRPRVASSEPEVAAL